MSVVVPAPAVPLVVAAPAVLPIHDPLPLPAPGWGVTDALAALAEARLALPVALPEATVVSALTTVVLRSGGLAVKVYPPGTDPEHLARITAALRPTSTALLPVGGPVVTSHGVVSVSPWLPAAPPVDWAEAGALLRRFHAECAGADVPVWTPLRRLPGQVAELPAGAAGVLLAARAALLAALCELNSELGVDVLHGDVSPTNMLRTAAGPRLIDLDFVAVGPREYDLASAARRVAAGELDRGTYRRFCEGYGYDVRDWEGLEVVNRLAELGGVAFRLWDARHHGRDLDWVPGVVAEWRTPL